MSTNNEVKKSKKVVKINGIIEQYLIQRFGERESNNPEISRKKNNPKLDKVMKV